MDFLSRSFEDLNIDYVLSLIKVITPYGRELKRKLVPFRTSDRDALEREYDMLALFLDSLKKDKRIFSDLRDYFKEIKDLKETIQRIQNDVLLNEVELFEMKNLTRQFRMINEELKKINIELPDNLYLNRLVNLEELFDPASTGINTFYIYDEYSDELKEIRISLKKLEKELRLHKKDLYKSIGKELSINISPRGEFTVLKSDKFKVEQLSESDQVVYSSENYMNITFTVKSDTFMDEHNEKIIKLKLLEEEEEKKVREYLTSMLKKNIERITFNLESLAKLDLYIAKSFLAYGTDSVRPELSSEGLNIVKGRHIAVEANLRKDGKTFTPISVDLRRGTTVITGANMGGKTVSLKLIGLLVSMVHYGLYIPAERMETSLFEYVFISVGDLQNIDKGLSTFGSEIVEITNAIRASNKRGLILIDELARGTNPKEGYAISKAIIDELKTKKTISVITTHYDGLADGDDVLHLQVNGLRGVEFDDLFIEEFEDIDAVMDFLNHKMDYTLKTINKPEEIPRDAINISALMGLDKKILLNAKLYLKQLNN